MKIDLTYHYLTHHIVPGPQSFSYFVPLLLLPTALLIPRTTLSKWQSLCLFLPAMTISTVHAWYAMNGTDVISVDVLFQALFFLAFQDPWTRYAYVPPPVEGPTTPLEPKCADATTAEPVSNTDSDERTPLKPPPPQPSSNPPPLPQGQRYPSTLRARVPWTLTLLSSIRLNNWRIGHPSHDTRQPPAPAFRTRTRFLLQALLSFTRGYLTLDLTRAYISGDAYFTSTSPVIPITSPLQFAHPAASIPPLAQFTRTMVIGLQAWALISQLFYLPAALPVLFHALHLLPATWSPHTWAPFFGPSRAVFAAGVRGFWGGYWHQTMRWMTTGPGYALAARWRLPGGGVARYAVVSGSAFLLSGVTHMGLVPPEPLHASVSVNAIRLYVAGFFWVQPVAMLAEVVVGRLAVRTLPPSVSRSGRIRGVVNAVWVLAWFTLCVPLLGEAGRQLGYWRVWPVPVSLWKGLRGEGWVAWPFLLA